MGERVDAAYPFSRFLWCLPWQVSSLEQLGYYYQPGATVNDNRRQNTIPVRSSIHLGCYIFTHRSFLPDLFFSKKNARLFIPGKC